MKERRGIIFIIILTLVPIVSWLFIEPLNYRFFNFVATMTSFGQVAGIVGLTLFSINLILSVRFKKLESFFYGLDRIYRLHSKIGAISFSLILFHPLFLVMSYLSVSLKSAIDFFIPLNNIPVAYGTLSLLLMMVLMIVTFYIKLKYNYWKFSHKFLTVSFALAMLHVFFISSDVSRDLFLRYYLLIFGSIGLLAGFYQSFFSKFINFNSIYILKKINIINLENVELELEPKNKKINFLPGQFIFLRFLRTNISSESHPFSISSASSNNNLQVVIKSLGDFTSKLGNLQPGVEVAVEGPYGKFSYLNIINKNQIWIAGGIGITPFISMARSLENNDYQIDLYYCINKIEEAILTDELREIEKNKKIRIIYWCSCEKGRLRADNIKEISTDLNNKDILLCGPHAFMVSLKEQLLILNINKKNIHFENFKFL